jgi:hypothetical protein
MKPQPRVTAALRLSWHARPGGNTLAEAGGGGWEEVAITWRRPGPPPPYRRKHFMFSAPGFRRLRRRPGTGSAPGWYSGRRHPRRCGEMSEAKASPARAPPRHGRLRRPEPHPQPSPVSAPFLCRSRAQLIPTTLGVRRLVPHRQNDVGGYVFTQRLSGRPGAAGRLEASPALPVSHSIRIFAGEVRALPSSVSMPRAIVVRMLRHGWCPESGEEE